MTTGRDPVYAVTYHDPKRVLTSRVALRDYFAAGALQGLIAAELGSSK